MKFRNALLSSFVVLLLSMVSMAWDCPKGQIRQQAPPNTPVTTPYYDVVEGIAFICVPTPTTPTTPTGSNTNTNSSTSTSGSSSSSNQNQHQKQNQNQTQSNSSTNTNNNQSAGGSVSNVGNSQTLVEAPKIPVNTAVAPPVFSTSNCFKGFSGGAQTAVAGLSFGGGGIDKNCAALVTAQALYAVGSREGACRVIISTKAAKAAGVTLEICMASMPVPEPKPVAVPVLAPPAPIVVTPSVTVNVPPAYPMPYPRETITVTAPAAKLVRPAKRVRKPVQGCRVTPIQNQCAVAPKGKN